VPNCDILEYPFEEPGWVPEARDAMLLDPPRPRGGVIQVPRGPGIGVELDREVMEKYGTRL
jgi:L-alanine-DL-glutamate epimerase-like enolase superfamily enzyme